jgi:ligand-binding SRPBCC domain-containing protein
MATLTISHVLTHPITEVFERLIDARYWPAQFPAELAFQVLDGPERLHLGALLRVQMRRWGLTVRALAEVTTFEPPFRLTLTHRETPFRRWVHHHELETVPDGTRLTDRIDYEPPGGILGLTLTTAWIERDLQWVLSRRPHLIVAETP